MSESNLPPEQWRPFFDRVGIEFGYRPLAARAGLTHTRVHRLIRGGGTTDAAIDQVAAALGVKASKVRELRGEAAVEVEPFILPDDAGRLNDTERDVVRRVVRALLDARDRNAEQPATDTADPTPATRAQGTKDQKTSSHATDVDTGTDPEGQAADAARPNVWRDKPTDLSEHRSRRKAGRDFGKDPLIREREAAYEGDAGSTDYDHTSGPPADAPDPAGPEDGA